MVRRAGLGLDLGLWLFALLAVLIIALAQVPTSAQPAMVEAGGLNSTFAAVNQAWDTLGYHYGEAGRFHEEAMAHWHGLPTLLTNLEQAREIAELTFEANKHEGASASTIQATKKVASDARQAKSAAVRGAQLALFAVGSALNANDLALDAMNEVIELLQLGINALDLKFTELETNPIYQVDSRQHDALLNEMRADNEALRAEVKLRRPSLRIIKEQNRNIVALMKEIVLQLQEHGITV